MAEHKHAAVLRAIADGKEVECMGSGGYWSCGISGANPIGMPSLAWRVKPQVIYIGSTLLPAPDHEKPEMRGEYYHIANMDWNAVVCYSTWTDHRTDETRLKRGLIWRSEKDAREVAQAIITLLGGRI